MSGVGGINTNQIDSMLAMLRNMGTQATAPSSIGAAAAPPGSVEPSGKAGAVSFKDMLKNSLDQANQVQLEAQQLGNRFAAGDNKISLSDLMIKTQEANISLQTTVQVRNKVVAAYTDIMNMQI